MIRDPRLRIRTAATTARDRLAATADVASRDTERIASAWLMALTASTDVADIGQRSIALPMAAKTGAVSVTVPEASTLVAPGRYVLFLVDDRSVSSVAHRIEVP